MLRYRRLIVAVSSLLVVITDLAGVSGIWRLPFLVLCLVYGVIEITDRGATHDDSLTVLNLHR